MKVINWVRSTMYHVFGMVISRKIYLQKFQLIDHFRLCYKNFFRGIAHQKSKGKKSENDILLFRTRSSICWVQFHGIFVYKNLNWLIHFNYFCKLFFLETTTHHYTRCEKHTKKTASILSKAWFRSSNSYLYTLYRPMAS